MKIKCAIFVSLFLSCQKVIKLFYFFPLCGDMLAKYPAAKIASRTNQTIDLFALPHINKRWKYFVKS